MTALAVTGIRVWDGVADTTSPGPQTIRIEGGRIAAIGTDPALLREARVIEPGPEAVALPGLIDAHVHMTLDPAVRSPADQLKIPPDEVMRAMEGRARAMLRAGITTARDLGGGEWLEVELRDRIARGELAGPRLLCAGQPLTLRGGHCHFWGGIVSGPDEIRNAIQRQVEHRADLIKVMATGGVMTRGTRITSAQFSRAELELMRAEAERRGRRVAAHCHGTAGIRNAVDARLRTIEHCSFAGEKGFGDDLDPALLERIASQDTWVSPTVNAGWRRFLADKQGRPTGFLERMRAVFRALTSAGARVVASTDAGIPGVAHHDLAHALDVFATYSELSPAAVLSTATSESARALELDGETGRLSLGLCADLLVVQGDPLRDLAALREPLLVVARGNVVEP